MISPVCVSFQYWTKGGVLLIPIGGVCLFIWLYFLRMNYRLKEALSAPVWLEDTVQSKLSQGEEWDRITEFVSTVNGFFCGVISYVLEKVGKGVGLSEVIEEIRQKEFSSFERDLTVLKALVTSAPLLGLLGTVWGMGDTFGVISARDVLSSELIASGISKALITTQFGLVVALPGIFGITILTRKLRQLNVRFLGLEFHLAIGLRRKVK